MGTLLIDRTVPLDAETTGLAKEVGEAVRRDDDAARLMTIPGVRPVTVMALQASRRSSASGDVGTFAWLGLVPCQHTTGGKWRLGGISKRGSVISGGCWLSAVSCPHRRPVSASIPRRRATIIVPIHSQLARRAHEKTGSTTSCVVSDCRRTRRNRACDARCLVATGKATGRGIHSRSQDGLRDRVPRELPSGAWFALARRICGK